MTHKSERLTAEQLTTAPVGTVILVERTPFKRTKRGWRPCNPDTCRVFRGSDVWPPDYLADKGATLA